MAAAVAFVVDSSISRLGVGPGAAVLSGAFEGDVAAGGFEMTSGSIISGPLSVGDPALPTKTVTMNGYLIEYVIPVLTWDSLALENDGSLVSLLFYVSGASLPRR
jgi:hypothetical protein